MGAMVYDRELLWPVILERLADGETLKVICESEGMPTPQAVRLWAREEPYASLYAQAREAQAHAIVEEIIEASRQDPERVTMHVGENTTKEQVDAGEVQHRRLLVDTLKWAAAKTLPKIYGDRIAVDHGAQDNLADLIAKGRARAAAEIDAEKPRT